VTLDGFTETTTEIGALGTLGITTAWKADVALAPVALFAIIEKLCVEPGVRPVRVKEVKPGPTFRVIWGLVMV
jgi:hypothetical protein